MTAIRKLIAGLPLKRMEASLLRSAIETEATQRLIGVRALRDAMDVSAYLHKNDLRANRGKMPNTHYIEHPLRVALRLMRAGCCDPDVLIAAILHDTVEDHAIDIVQDLIGELRGEATSRQASINFYRHRYGNEIARIVLAVTNPEIDPQLGCTAEQKAGIYRNHVLEAIVDPKAFLVKLSDLIDNAMSLKYTAEHMGQARVARLVAKYQPLIPVFVKRLGEPDVAGFVGTKGVEELRHHLTAHDLAELVH